MPHFCLLFYAILQSMAQWHPPKYAPGDISSPSPGDISLPAYFCSSSDFGQKFGLNLSEDLFFFISSGLYPRVSAPLPVLKINCNRNLWLSSDKFHLRFEGKLSMRSDQRKHDEQPR